MCIICFLFNFGYYKYALLRIKRETVLIIPKKNMEENYIYKGDDTDRDQLFFSVRNEIINRQVM